MYSTKNIADDLNVPRTVINYHIRKGNLEADKNYYGFYEIEQKKALRFIDWFLFDKGKNTGMANKAIPMIDEFESNPKAYNPYVSLKIQRDKSILEAKFLNNKKYKYIAKDFNLSIRSIQNIVLKNRDTDFVKQLKKMRDIFR